MKRRSFFKSLGVFAAVIALAPEIAFCRKLKLRDEITSNQVPFWIETKIAHRYYSTAYIEKLNAMIKENPNYLLQFQQ